MTLVVDASVAVLWGVEDPLAEVAEALLLSSRPLIAPDFILIEVANAVWKIARRGGIQGEQAEGIVERIPRALTELVSPTVVWSQALRIARQLDHPVYDCAYLALAESRGAPLVTLDKRLHARTRSTPWETLTVLLGGGTVPV
ncbi:putative nucleic acid-binding protein [Azospirillum sp. OGB3]|uniref:type II toxin-antitoxin system VapC family toxin n=1 Tax=Azospirillum sp. OGB3 TaxID=2587012 RepID=UPI00160631CD|nr:type II toxin-antitoxin system VapC family toxin [Azospirillum sp. OGB3]MBB3264364.1 putative nucleic acid-binding protein [Azospirillum sp. OGB3]